MAVLSKGPHIEKVYYACSPSLYIEQSRQNIAVCWCTIEIPHTLKCPAAEVISEEAIFAEKRDI